MLVPDRVWALLTEDEQRLIRETINGERKSGLEIACPHCQGMIKVSAKIHVRAKDEHDTDKPAIATVQASAPNTTSAKDATLLQTAKASGLFDAFARALIAEKEHTGVPSDIEEFFTTFMRNMEPVIVPKMSLAAWMDEFGGRIEVYGTNGVLAVVSDGEIKEFMPNRFVRRSTTMRGPQLPTAALFENWTKGRYGYVPSGSGVFAQAMRQRNIGTFGAIVQ